MASQQAFQAYAQNKGTLMPGQTISVNNYTVQVERYLSQGGFAHVYLVRTPTPVYNTTHHVLKRIAVANESMLTDVKKEVDIMRLLKGHPNIVHLIDAAWHKLPNGTFEVFILMEYCPGGGIIDMMNRRLRERLTEAEILQIFVDVCEGVAYMHNSRPPLLHRDLKVENILQSSPASFKLCDFGSSTTVSNAPSNMQEIRALEADLNRHTTLQYRAPEMVDVYSKRPVNEKSDVWALGVLLYKLCYYTTPFEEHGPLAILNVQYRIPPYPVYSQDMNMLIGSMLREHGAQRPSVFELLNHVHRLRGSKSKFTYSVPVPAPLLPRPHQHQNKPSPSPNALDGTVTYNNAARPPISLYDPKSPPASAAPNQGVQARDKVLEAIAPMRRGRPNHSREPSSSRPPSPPKIRQGTQDMAKGWSETGFGADHDKAWQAATTSAPGKTFGVDDAWSIADSKARPEPAKRPSGFGDDFAEKLWNSADPNGSRISPKTTSNTNGTKPNEPTATPIAFTGSRMLRPKQDRVPQNQNRDKDAFEGLGLMTSSTKPAPTLGEARKLRTGLATMSTTTAPPQGDYLRRDFDKANGLSPRPPPSPRPTYLSSSPSGAPPKSISPVPTPGSSSSPSWTLAPHAASNPGISSSTNADGMPIESRFPSLEELDAQFIPSANSFYPSVVNEASSKYAGLPSSRSTENRSQYSSRLSHIGTAGTGGNLLKPNIISNVSYSVDGVRSQQVTGVAMRESKDSRNPEATTAVNRPPLTQNSSSSSTVPIPPPKEGMSPSRPMLVRKHRSSMSMKPSISNAALENSLEPSDFGSNNLAPPKLPPRPPTSTSAAPRDWLTGEDHDVTSKIQPPPEVPVLRDSPSKRASFIAQSDFNIPSGDAAQHMFAERLVDESHEEDFSPTVSRFNRAFPVIGTGQTAATSGPTDNWSPIRKETDPDSSSADEGPEDPKRAVTTTQKTHAARGKGRQSSVHDLVYQYGGGLAGKEKESERLPPQTSAMPPKAQVTGLVPPAGRLDTGRKTPSPTNHISKPTSAAPTRSSHQRQSSTATSTTTHQPKPQAPPIKSPSTSASASRSRPQSMFIFPSRSTDSSSNVTSPTSLVPPEEPKQRTTRRTSISDMVQRYEAIGGRTTPSASASLATASLSPGPPSPIHRPVSAKGGTSNVGNGALKAFPDSNKPFSSQSAGTNETFTRGGDPPKSRTMTEALKQNTGTGISRSPTKGRRVSEKIPTSATDNISRTRKMSLKTEPFSVFSSSSRTEPLLSSRPARNSPEISNTQRPRSPRKPTISISQNPTSSKADEPPRSPSPDKPYRGVGKLIDQWQKKSAEAEQTRPVVPAKRTFVPKTFT